MSHTQPGGQSGNKKSARQGFADSVNINASKISEDLLRKSIEGELRIAMIGSVSGAFTIVIGVLFVILGLTGSIEFVFSGMGFNSKLAKASPGVVFVIAGMLLILMTRPKIDVV
jgi:hypothetical protein